MVNKVNKRKTKAGAEKWWRQVKWT